MNNKLENFRQAYLVPLGAKIESKIQEIEDIYNNYLVPYENLDDSFRTQLDTLYDNLTSDADKRQNNWEFFKSISSSFIEGFIVGVVVALAVVMLPGSVVAGGIVILGVGCVAMTAVPEEKVPSWLQGSRDIGNQLITDPLSITYDMGQGFMDQIQKPVYDP